MKDLKIIILFIVILSGCSRKYIKTGEEEPTDFGILSSGKNLAVSIVKQSEVNLSINLQVRECDFVIVKDSQNIDNPDLRVLETVSDKIRADGVSKVLWGCALAGCAGLASAVFVYGEAVNPSGGGRYRLATCIGVIGGVGSLALSTNGIVQAAGASSIERESYKIDTVCFNSISMSGKKAEVKVENANLEKIYWTDEDGNIELKFNEIIPEPTEADSVLNIIIRYGEMADTVEVGRL